MSGLVRDQLQFGGCAPAPAIIFRRAIAGGYAVAGDDDGVGVKPTGAAHSARAAIMRSGQCAIGCGATIRNAGDRRAEMLPASAVERDEGKIKDAARAVKIFANLGGGGHGRAIVRA